MKQKILDSHIFLVTDEAMHSKRLLLSPIVCIIGLLLCPQPPVHAQGWQWQNPLPQGDGLNLVTFVDRHHGWITSSGPILLRTKDGGKNWEILRTGIVFNDVHFIDPLEGWGIGNSRLEVIKWNIYHTTDGGATWEVQLADTTTRYDIFFLDAKHGWATNNKLESDELLFTNDGGKSWMQQAQGEFRPNDEIRGITFLDLLKGWVVGFSRWGIRTTDGGTTWKRDSTLVGVMQLFFADSLHGWGRQASRWVFRTSDGGEAWERIQVTDAFGEVRSNHFFAFDSRRCFVALNVGLYASADGGQNWTRHSSQELTSFAFLDSMEAWGVVGNKLLHSIDGGRNWQNLTKNILPEGVIYLSSVDFVDTQTGWATGVGRTQRNDGVILHTRDGGVTWTEQWLSSGKQFEQIFFVDERHGWAVGFDGYIVHTNNSGQTWRIQNSGTDFILRAVTFVDTLRGWIVGERPVDNRGIILCTNDGGKTWLDQTPVGAFSLAAVTFLDTLNGWVVGKMVFRTKDGGKNWILLRQGTGLGSVAFADSLHGWAAGYDPLTDAIIIYTEDGGKTWSPQLSGTYYAPKNMKFVGSLHGWAVGLFGQIHSTSDGGLNWREQQGYTSQWLEAVDFVNTQTGWIVGWHGAILHTKSGGVSIVKQSLPMSSLPKRFFLYGNYPNPFNAQTKIRFEIFGSKAKVRLQVYNLHGHVVARLVDGQRPAGLHEISWDGKNDKGIECASGLYFYRLEADGIAQVGKAVLLQ
ncbi:MAG: YCF48-related protein [candidate division KSB1 bacterium]|nr:YCF48-related protein [candidate division KSB1 bacterium]